MGGDLSVCWSHEGNLKLVVESQHGAAASVASTGPAGQEALLASFASHSTDQGEFGKIQCFSSSFFSIFRDG